MTEPHGRTAKPEGGRRRRPMAHQGLSDRLAEEIVALIQDRQLAPGDPLEPLRSLASRYQVAVPTAREALRRLEATGAIEFRHGSGIYVGAHVGRLVMPNPNSGRPTGDQLLHLLDARLVIEPPLAELAAAGWTGDLEPLRDALDRSSRYLADNDEQLSASNLDFHREIARAAGNPVLFDVVDSLLAVHEREQREILALYDDRVQDHAEHVRILDAVASRDLGEARELMAAHLAEVRSVIIRRTVRGSAARADPIAPSGSDKTGAAR